jgi:hypothetical protein
VVIRQIIKRRWTLVGVVAALLLTMACLALYPFHILSFKDLSNNKTIHQVETTPGDNLWIVFVNSAEGLPVADHFVVNENYEILFTETIFQAPYAGYDKAKSLEVIAPNTTKISGYDRQMKEITFYAGYTFRHMLFLNGNWLPLYDVAQGGDLILIKIEKSSWMTSLLKRIISHDR